MKTILNIIKPIKLLQGTHSDTAKTGQGCAMNVIAYLNGEDQITDQSPCVCVTVRKTLIWFNDYLKDEERQELVPYLLRAMGSATEDKTVINARLVHVVKFANAMVTIAKRAAANATKAAATYATYAANYAAANAAKAATYATYAANADYATYATYAAKAATYATYAANADYAATYATYAANADYAAATYAAARKEIKAAAFAFLDAVLSPLVEPSQEIISRAEKLVELSK